MTEIMDKVRDFYCRESDGWCTEDKAQKIVEICTHPEINRCVEIGVFAGRSLIPAAFALASKKTVITDMNCLNPFIVGIDPYNAKRQVEGFEDRANHNDWGLHVPWEDLHARALSHIQHYGLGDHAAILRTPSACAASLFESQSLDYVHIDGNHSVTRSFQDAITWYDRLRVGGYLIFDDVNWDTTQDAVRYLDGICETVFKSSPDWWTIYKRVR